VIWCMGFWSRGAQRRERCVTVQVRTGTGAWGFGRAERPGAWRGWVRSGGQRCAPAVLPWIGWPLPHLRTDILRTDMMLTAAVRDARRGAWGFARAFRIPGCSASGQASHADLASAPEISTDLGRRRRGVQVHGVLPATMRADMNWSRQRRCILTVHGVLPATRRIGAAWSSRCLAWWRIALFRRGGARRRDGLMRPGFATFHGSRRPWGDSRGP